jgi:hypothetical protein
VSKDCPHAHNAMERGMFQIPYPLRLATPAGRSHGLTLKKTGGPCLRPASWPTLPWPVPPNLMRPDGGNGTATCRGLMRRFTSCHRPRRKARTVMTFHTKDLLPENTRHSASRLGNRVFTQRLRIKNIWWKIFGVPNYFLCHFLLNYTA